MSLQNIFIYVVTGLLSICNVFNLHNSNFFDNNVYVQVANTSIYAFKNITPNELNEIISNYNKVPSSVIEKLNEYKVNIYLIDDTTKETKYNYVDGVPSFIERDKTDIRNLKTVLIDNCTYLLYHGIYIGPIDNEYIDWSYWTEKYVQESDIYGKNYFNYDHNLDTTIGKGFSIPTEEYDNLNVTGVYHYVSNKDYNPEFIIHEIGKELDNIVGLECYGNYDSFVSKDQSWLNLYELNKNKMSEFDNLAKKTVCNNEIEGFAEAFRLCLQYTNKLKELCPDVYDYVYNFISMYGSDNVHIDNFNYKGYADRYSDLKEAFGYNRTMLYNHFLEYGILEKRIG